MRKMKDSGVEWIGDMPQEWEVRKVKSLLLMLTGFTPDTKNDKYYDDTGIDWVTIGDLTGDKYIPKKTKKSISKAYIDEFSPDVVPEGSLLYSFKLSVGQTAFADRPVYTNEAIASFLESPQYTLDFLRFASFLIEYNANTNIYGANLLNQDLIKNALLVVPPIKEQKIIATYLDQKCGQVDTLIANVQTQIEKLKAYKQSLITEVVTKGLDPTVPMKDSGVEWIGEIPEHWKINRIKNLFELRNERNEEADLSKVNLISLYTDLGVVQHSDIVETTGNKAVTAEGYKIVRKNDIVVNIILCWMGAVGMSKYDGVTSPAYDIYRPLEGTNSEYYHYLFRTYRFNGECYRYGRGIMMMRWRTYSTEFRSINIPCPPIEEQKKIVTYLNDKILQIDKLIDIKQSKIEKLSEYKKSLIYEYVTGKKEVPVG